MPHHVTSDDGTRIAYDHLGEGPPVVVVGGIFCDRERLADLAATLADQLAGRASVVNYDRRGRGDSADTPPYAVEREIDDLAAVAGATGGGGGGGVLGVYGHSSGAGLALRAAAAGLPMGRLVLHEPPYGGDDEESRAQARQLAEEVRAAIAGARRGDAIRAFMADAGPSDDILDAMADDPKMLALAPTMPYDLAVMGDGDQGGVIPVDLVRAIEVPTLVVAGGASPDFFRDTARRLVELLPDGHPAELPDHGHDAPAAVVAPVVARFLAG